MNFLLGTFISKGMFSGNFGFSKNIRAVWGMLGWEFSLARKKWGNPFPGPPGKISGASRDKKS